MTLAEQIRQQNEMDKRKAEQEKRNFENNPLNSSKAIDSRRKEALTWMIKRITSKAPESVISVKDTLFGVRKTQWKVYKMSMMHLGVSITFDAPSRAEFSFREAGDPEAWSSAFASYKELFIPEKKALSFYEDLVRHFENEGLALVRCIYTDSYSPGYNLRTGTHYEIAVKKHSDIRNSYKEFFDNKYSYYGFGIKVD